jgi:hypothetical protein
LQVKGTNFLSMGGGFWCKLESIPAGISTDRPGPIIDDFNGECAVSALPTGRYRVSISLNNAETWTSGFHEFLVSAPPTKSTTGVPGSSGIASSPLTTTSPTSSTTGVLPLSPPPGSEVVASTDAFSSGSMSLVFVAAGSGAALYLLAVVVLAVVVVRRQGNSAASSATDSSDCDGGSSSGLDGSSYRSDSSSPGHYAGIVPVQAGGASAPESTVTAHYTGIAKVAFERGYLRGDV